MASIRYEFIMSQITFVRDIKETEKVKISLVFYEGCQDTCILKVYKNRDLSGLYQTIMGVKHQNLTVVYDCVYENGDTYILEEYVQGKTIAEKIEEEGVFSEEDASRCIREVCDGLTALHMHEPPIIHNDIKPSNIMLSEDGMVKLFDYDISRIYKVGVYKNTNLMGTHEYAAPEHYGFGQSEPGTDIYSLGVTLHEMLTGVGLDAEHNVIYEGVLFNIIQKCVEIDPQKRYTSASLLKKDLEKTQKKSGFIICLFAVLICVLLLLLGAFLMLKKDDEKELPMEEGTENVTENIAEITTEIIGTESIETESVGDETTQSAGTELPNKEEVTKDNTGKEENNNPQPPVKEEDSDVVQEESVVKKKAMKTVYKIQDTFLAMNVWKDGSFVLFEEVSDNYYLTKSDGTKVHLGELDYVQTAQLEYNPYTDQMYLLVFNFNGWSVYSVTKNLELDFIVRDDIQGKSGAFVAFLTNGNILCDFLLLDGNDWSIIGSVVSCPGPTMICDRLYSFGFDVNGTELLYQFLEIDESGSAVGRYPLAESGIKFKGSSINDPLANNSEDVCFIGYRDGKDYIFRFDGEKFTSLACLSDYTGYTLGNYDDVCVTDKTLRYYSSSLKAVVEFEFE